MANSVRSYGGSDQSQSQSQRTDKRGSVASALFPHTGLSYQKAAGALHPAAQGRKPCGA
jgi:hypothetical protein